MTFSPRLRQTAALTILGAALVLLWIVAVSPVTARLEADRLNLARARMQLAHAEDLIQSEPAMQDQLAQLKRAHDSRRVFLDGNDPTLLSAQFQQSVQQIVSGSGAEIGSSQTIAAHRESQLIRVGLQLELMTNAGGLHRLLYDLETASPLIVVDRLAVRVPENGIAIAAGVDGQPELSISMGLVAYAKPGRTGAPL